MDTFSMENGALVETKSPEDLTSGIDKLTESDMTDVMRFLELSKDVRNKVSHIHGTDREQLYALVLYNELGKTIDKHEIKNEAVRDGMEAIMAQIGTVFKSLSDGDIEKIVNRKKWKWKEGLHESFKLLSLDIFGLVINIGLLGIVVAYALFVVNSFMQVLGVSGGDRMSVISFLAILLGFVPVLALVRSVGCLPECIQDFTWALKNISKNVKTDRVDKLDNLLDTMISDSNIPNKVRENLSMTRETIKSLTGLEKLRQYASIELTYKDMKNLGYIGEVAERKYEL